MLQQNHLGLLAVLHCALWHQHGHIWDCCLQRYCGLVLATELDIQQKRHVPVEAELSSYTHTRASMRPQNHRHEYHAQSVNDYVAAVLRRQAYSLDIGILLAVRLYKLLSLPADAHRRHCHLHRL